MKLLIISLLIGITSCSPQDGSSKYIPNLKAKQLNDSAIHIASIPTEENYIKAISLLDKATEIDTNNFIAYHNKLSLEFTIKRYDKALTTAKEIIRIKPNFPEFYGTLGTLYYKTGDTVTAKKYYTDAIVLIDKILDTLAPTNPNYDELIMSKGVTLILADEQESGRRILNQLAERQSEGTQKDMILSFMNKTKKELISTSNELK